MVLFMCASKQASTKGIWTDIWKQVVATKKNQLTSKQQGCEGGCESKKIFLMALVLIIERDSQILSTLSSSSERN